jgi:hypothetical protein
MLSYNTTQLITPEFNFTLQRITTSDVLLTYSLPATDRYDHVKMPEIFSSLPFFAPLSTGNYYAKNIHTHKVTKLAYRMSEFAAEQISFVFSQCILPVYIMCV